MAHIRSTNDSAYWLRLLGRQRDLYRALHTLAQRQRHLIAGDHPEALLDILQQRHRLVRALARLNARLTPVRDDWANATANWPEAARRLAENLLAETREIMHDVLASDEQDSQLLAARQQALSQQVRAIPDARAANRAYARQREALPPEANEQA